MRNSSLLAVLLLVAAFSAHAQDTSTALEWTVGGLRDLNTGQDQATYACTFRTNGMAPIQWVQNNNYVTPLDVKTVSGTWTDVSKKGKVVYNITWEGDAGTLTFERIATGAYITLDVAQSDTQAGIPARFRQRYTVTQVVPQP